MADAPVATTTYTPQDMARAMGGAPSLSQEGSGWMGATPPIAPIAPPDVAGRRFDYQFGFNKIVQPKLGDSASALFPTLRALSEGWDLLRAVIETRKDIGSTVPLLFRDRNWKPGKPESKGIAEVRRLFRKPDGRTPITTWRRAIREDLYVLDAPTIYVTHRGSRAVGFEYLDGATIKILSDDYGRVPLEGPAYQQVLKGAQAVNYTAEEIIYAPRNPRPHRFYGFGMVEQSIITIETGLRRALGQLNHFTDGNIPEMFISCPESWQPEQVKEMQQLWDDILSGNLKARSGARFIPGGMKPEQIRTEALLKNEFDEWSARLLFFIFSLSVQPMVKDMNRATAESADKTAKTQGVLSELAWEKDLFDDMLDRAGFPEIEAIHDTGDDPDPTAKSAIIVSQFQAGLITPEFAMEKLGYPADAMAKPKEDLKIDPAQPSKKAEEDGKKGCGHDHEASKADSDEPLFDLFQSALDKLLEPSQAWAEAIHSGTTIPKNLWTKSEQKAFFLSARTELTQIVSEGMATARAKAGTEQAVRPLANAAKEWAADRSAWLIGKRLEDGRLVDNPNATYAITNEAREAIRATVSRAFEERWTPQRLSEELSTHYAFSPARALMIARTELAEAQEAGSMIYAKAAGATKKSWSGSADCCPLCAANIAAGEIGINDEFPSGHKHGPAHPSDRCRVLFIYGAKNV